MASFPILIKTGGVNQIINNVDELPLDQSFRIVTKNVPQQKLTFYLCGSEEYRVATDSIELKVCEKEKSSWHQEKCGVEFAEYLFDKCPHIYTRAVYDKLKELFKNQ